MTILDVNNNILNCSKCDVRVKCRSPVTGSGEQSKIMIVGQNPGQQEDEAGLPFVGRCGVFLNKCLIDAGIDRKSIYITNLMKCATPNNRPPTPNEISNCREYLQNEIKLISPKYILGLGGLAIKGVYGKKTTMYKPTILECEGQQRIFIPCYHPSYFLRWGKNTDTQLIDILKGIARD